MTDTKSLELRLSRLEAVEEIRDLKRRYARYCDTGCPPEMVAETFTEDAVYDTGRFGRFEGHEELAKLYAETPKTFLWTMHLMVNEIIEVAEDGESATGIWYMFAPETLELEGKPESMWLVGMYTDEYRRTPAGWRVSNTKLDFDLIARALDGWHEQPIVLGN